MKLTPLITVAGLALAATPAAGFVPAPHHHVTRLRIPAHGQVAWHSAHDVAGDIQLDGTYVNGHEILLGDTTGHGNVVRMYGRGVVVSFGGGMHHRFWIRATTVSNRPVALRVRWHPTP